MKTITYTVLENHPKTDPLYLQHLLLDLPFNLNKTDVLEITVTIPTGKKVFIIDDLYFEHTAKNKIDFVLEERSQLEYQLFVANHHLCAQCADKEKFDCQPAPTKFEKELTITMNGEYSYAKMRCHYLGEQSNKFKLKSIQRHLASHTNSTLLVKGVLDDHAQLTCDNLIFIEKGLEKVVAAQQNKNLILSKQAHVTSIPKLEVLSRDVNCVHGASMSNLNPEHIFYLQCRGSSLDETKIMLMKSFLE